MELYRPSVVKEVLRENGLRAKKAFGQNFLIDRNILEKIGEAAEFKSQDNVLEVGPGLGTLGAFFAPKVRKWSAVEIDHDFRPHLNALEAIHPNFEVVYGDFRRLQIEQLVGEEEYKFVANLPYYITTPIVEKVVESNTPWERMVLMVQWEVAQRLTASPGSKEYGSLTIFVQYYGTVEIITKVSRNSFYPAPEVDSAIIAVRRHSKPPVQVSDPSFLFKVVRSAFHQRRKKLVNSLVKAPYLEVSTQKLQEALAVARISPDLRGEMLTLPDFARLAEALYQLL